MPFSHLRIIAMRCPYPDNWIPSQNLSETPKTVGEYIKKRRLELHLLQSQVAEKLGVHTTSLQNWERGVSIPMIRHWPGIIDFLGYDPEPEPAELSDRIAYARRRLGWTQEELARNASVDPVTVYRWENGSSIPLAEKLSKIQAHLGTGFQLTCTKT